VLSFLVGLFLLFAATVPTAADADNSVTAQPAKIVDQYNGGFKDDYPQEFVLVQSYLPTVQSEVATQLGLQFGQGFRHPVTVRFDYGAPSVNENPFFYEVSKGSGQEFSQNVVANVEAYARRKSDQSSITTGLRGGLRYAMTQVMLNDFIGGDPDLALPVWVQEGLAVYASGSGENFVKSVASRTAKSKTMDLTGDLNSPGPYLTAQEWARYYLAIKYIATTGTLQTFVRDMTNGKSPADAVRDSLSQEWPVFETNVRKFSADNYATYAMNDDDSQTRKIRY